MTTLFPAGQLVACSDFLSLIPRSAMIQAIVRHVTDPRPIRDGEPIRSERQHDGIGFHLLTIEGRTRTLLRLDDTTVRLACTAYDRDDTDGITPEQLEQAKAEGWTGIDEVQSYDDSMQSCDSPYDAPPEFAVTIAGNAPQGDLTGEFLVIADRPVDNAYRSRSRLALPFRSDQRLVGRMEFAGFAMLTMPGHRSGSALTPTG